jgi:hypothetical protein
LRDDKRGLLKILQSKNRVNFKADANVEEIFGLNKVKEVPVSAKDQLLFDEWDWVKYVFGLDRGEGTMRKRAEWKGERSGLKNVWHFAHLVSPNQNIPEKVLTLKKSKSKRASRSSGKSTSASLPFLL